MNIEIRIGKFALFYTFTIYRNGRIVDNSIELLRLLNISSDDFNDALASYEIENISTLYIVFKKQDVEKAQKFIEDYIEPRLVMRILLGEVV